MTPDKLEEIVEEDMTEFERKLAQAILGALEHRGFYDCGKYLDASLIEHIRPLLTQYHQDLMSEVDRKIENFDHNDIGLCRCSDAPQKCKCYYGGIETAQTIIKLSK